MSDEQINVEELTPGQVIWFQHSVKTDVDSASGGEVEDIFIYSATVDHVEQVAFRKGYGQVPAEAEYQIHLTDGDAIYWRVGEGVNYNPEIFLTREEAIENARYWYDSYLKDQEEELEKAQKAVAYLRERQQREIREIHKESADEGYYMSTVEEKEAEIAARSA